MGSNSFFSKLYTYDPLQHLGVSKYIDPAANAILGGGKYSTSSGPGTPGPYAGVTPTLADANAGYVRAAANPVPPAAGTGTSMNSLFGQQQPPTAGPRPVVRQPQPTIPGQQQQQTWT